MKRVGLLIILMATLFSAKAQRPDYKDLDIYFADNDLEKVISKSLKYTQGDDSRKDALPYLFLSLANFEISKGEDQDLLKDFPRAYKDAIKYASKAIQKDDDERTMYYNNIAHFTDLKEVIFEDVRNLASGGEYGKLAGTLPLMDKLEKNEVGIAFLKAVAKYHRGDKSGFRTDQSKALELLDAMESGSLIVNDDDRVDIAEKKELDREVFKYCIVQYAKLLVQMDELSEARRVLGKIKQLYEKDDDFMEDYNKIVN
ncbi:MAG: hypothetical protein AB8B74_14360 [Crocinitomicaceae bacterium]